MTYADRPWLSSYDPNVEHDVTVPEESLTTRLAESVARYAERPALHFMGETLTYAQLDEGANRIAQALKKHGVSPGDVVGINLPNIPQYLLALLGALRAGCAVSGVSPLLTPKEMAYQLNDCKAKALFTLDAIFEHRMAGIMGDLSHLDLIVCASIADYLPAIKRFLGLLLKKIPTGRVTPVPGKAVFKFKQLLDAFPDKSPGVEIAPDDPCLIQYTGGTTGVPKGTILSHRNLMANLTQVIAFAQPEAGDETFLSGFPFFHLAGLAMGLTSLAIGGTQVLIPDPRNTKHIVGEIGRYKPSVLVNVPSLYMMLLETPGFNKLDHSKLNFCVSGAAPFPADAITALEQVLGKGKLVEVYGMTEASPIVTMNPRHGVKKIGTVGIPVPSTAVRLVDIETGTRDVPFGEEGEVIVHGPQVMQGYLGKPDETRNQLRTLDGKKWLFTGDVARMDEDGYFTIADRTKDMLIVGGFKVFSREVEEKLYDHPAIELCAIIGVPNPDRPGNDRVKLVVQLPTSYKNKDPGSVKAEILEYCKANLAPYKVPKIVEFIDEVPLTAVGKVDKKALR